MDDLLLGIGIAIAIEGLLYAAFPNQLRAMMRHALSMPENFLRWGGVVALSLGVLIVWVVRG